MFKLLKLIPIILIGTSLISCTKEPPATIDCTTTITSTVQTQNPCNTNTGIIVQLFQHGKFIFNCNENTITLSTNLNVSSIDLLKFDQPASQCIILNPSFTIPPFASTYHVVEVEHPEFWDCVGDNGEEFYYEFTYCPEAVSDDVLDQ